MYDRHGFFSLLLERWEEFSTCPHLEGLRLFEITALYADVETAKLLAEIDYKKLRYDAKYPLRDFAKRVTERADVTDESIKAFDELLLVLNGNFVAPTLVSEVDKSLLSRPSALATLYDSEKIAADACYQPGQRRGSILITLTIKAKDLKIYKECISID